MAWTTPRTWVAGETVTAAVMNTHVRDNLNAAFPLGGVDSAWQSYTPALTAVTTSPTLGTGNVVFGAYTQIGKLVTGDAYIGFGTAGAAAGSGTYSLSLPVAAVTMSPSITEMIIGFGALTAAGNWTACWAFYATSTTVSLRYTNAAVNGTLVSASNSTPGVWTNNDQIRLHFAYQAA